MNEKNQKDAKLPLINVHKKFNDTKSIKAITDINKDNSTLQKNSFKENSAKNLNIDKKPPQKKENLNSNNILKQDINKSKLPEKIEVYNNKSKSGEKIDKIINDVNITRNINSKVIKKPNSVLNSNTNSKETENDNNSKKLINPKKKYKFKIYKPLNPLLSPHNDMSFLKSQKTKENFYKDLAKNLPKMSKEKLNEIKRRRNARLEKERELIEINNQKIINDIKGQNNIIKSREIVLNDILNNINVQNKISHKSAQKILEDGGMIEAYKYLIKNICKNGMPEGNVYDYCSDFIRNFEKVWQKMKFKILNKKIEKHFKEKRELLIKNNENPFDNIFFRVLEKREEMKFIKKLDKSRSSLHIIKRNQILDGGINKNNTNLLTNINNRMNNEIKINRNLDRKNNNLAINNGDNSEIMHLKINSGFKKNNIESNKVTFNIKLKEDERKQKEEMKINKERKNEKVRAKKAKKGNPEENNKAEKEINLNYIKDNHNNSNNKIKEIKDNDIQRGKRKPTIKKG